MPKLLSSDFLNASDFEFPIFGVVGSEFGPFAEHIIKIESGETESFLGWSWWSPDGAGSGVFLGPDTVLTAAHVTNDFNKEYSEPKSGEFTLTSGLGFAAVESEEFFYNSTNDISDFRMGKIEDSERSMSLLPPKLAADISILVADTVGISIPPPPLMVFQNPEDASGKAFAIGYPSVKSGESTFDGRTPYYTSGEIAGTWQEEHHFTDTGDPDTDTLHGLQPLWLLDGTASERGMSGSGWWLTYDGLGAELLGVQCPHLIGIQSIGSLAENSPLRGDTSGISSIGNVYEE